MVTTPDLWIVNKCSIHEWCNLNKGSNYFFWTQEIQIYIYLYLLPLKKCSLEPPQHLQKHFFDPSPPTRRPTRRWEEALEGNLGELQSELTKLQKGLRLASLGPRWGVTSLAGGVGVAGVSQREIPENTTDIQHIMDPFTLELVNFFKRKLLCWEGWKLWRFLRRFLDDWMGTLFCAGWQLEDFLNFHPDPWGNDPIWWAHFPGWSHRGPKPCVLAIQAYLFLLSKDRVYIDSKKNI